MGIGSNFYVEVAEQEHREKRFDIIIRKAAELVIHGIISRTKAIEQAESELLDAEEALSNEMPVDELAFESISTCKDKQIIAVANELHDEFESRFL